MKNSPLREVHEPYESIDAMLSTAELSLLLSQPVERVEQSDPTVWGNAGSAFSVIDTDVGRLILKTMSMDSDWEAFATEDVACRSVALWQFGLLDRVRPHLDSAIVACALQDDVGAILMYDLSGRFLWDSDVEPQAAEVRARSMLNPFLDAIAAMHAEFWGDPSLDDPRLGLETPRVLFQLASPVFARRHTDDWENHLVGMAIEGWDVLADVLSRDIWGHLKGLIVDPQPLLDALDRHPFTLLHGDLYKPNLAHEEPERLVAVDWQLAMRSLATVDVARFVGDMHGDRVIQEQAHRYYRRRLEGHLSAAFADDEWQEMIDLGVLTNALWTTPFVASAMRHIDEPSFQAQCRARLALCDQQVQDGIRWL